MFMKELSEIKIALNKNAEVVLVTNAVMNDENDIDSLFLNFFTILSDPLRLSILGVGCLSKQLANLLGTDEQSINNLLANDTDTYTNMLQAKTQELLVGYSEEYAKIVLNDEKNAKNARAILTSLISNGYYKQKVNYLFPSGNQKQEQIVEVKEMIPAFKQMLEIVKRYDDEEFLKELGV
jgi:hypothetical protein